MSQANTDLNKALKLIEEADGLIKKHATALTPEQRKAASKPPLAFLTGGAPFVEKVIAHPEVLAAGKHDPKVILTNLATADLFGKIESRLQGTTKLVADALLTSRANAYDPALRIYGVAQQAAETNSELQEIVNAGREFFPHHKRKPKKA